MTQHLWYVRNNGAVSGPFPTPQLQQLFSIGQLDLRDAVSLDGQHWISLLESGVLDAEHAKVVIEPDDDWRREREQARQRWLNDSVETDFQQTPDDLNEVDNRLRRHEEEIRTMMKAETSRRPAFIAGLASLLVVLVIGVGVWLGQSDENSIQTSLAGRVRNCKLGPAEGVVWTGCNKDDAMLHAANLKNAGLAQARFERADLSGADLSYADLDNANLRGANLHGANLSGASLKQADLSGADLGAANLRFAVLTGALLDGTSFRQSIWTDGRVCSEESVGSCQ